MKKYKKQKAFTIIELLVVISVIGLLSAIVLVSVRYAQKDAKMKATMQFSSNINHALLSDAVGFWSLDNVDLGNDEVPDDSGNGLTGDIIGTPSITDGVVRKALHLNDDYIYIETSTVLNVSDFTYSAWFKLGDLGWWDWQTIIDLGDNAQQLAVADRYLTLYGRCDGEWESTISDTDWHHVVWTVSGTDYAIYLDSKEVETGGGCLGSVNFNEIYIGTSFIGEVFIGDLDEIGFYKKALSVSEIRKLYAVGLYKIRLAEL